MGIRDEILHLKKQHGKKLTTQHVVTFAEDPDTALHSRFDWDDTSAARKYRHLQARWVLRDFDIEVEGPEGPQGVPGWVSLVSDRTTGGGYRYLPDVLSNKQLREELLAQALEELRLWEARYNQLTELAAVFEAAEKALEKHGRKKRPARKAKRGRRQPTGAR